MISSQYLAKLFNKKEIKKSIDKIVNLINGLDNIDQYAIVGTGISGIALLPTLSYLTDIKYVIIRKPDQSTHSNIIVEGNLNFKKYIIIDDFISSGNTIQKIINELKEETVTSKALLEGIILYYEDANAYELSFIKRNLTVG